MKMRAFLKADIVKLLHFRPIWDELRPDGFQIDPTESRQAAFEQLLALDTVLA